ncbi:hypothetical protein ACKI10_45350 [Streptomyces galilaeus]|uniref:Uncharacterized protein n=1 Tax=Streptomyces galilaeus TaxID=33899 RepID=A0ABW9IDJ8_STRGJ
MKHELSIQAETERMPAEPGAKWAEYRATGQAQLTCSCGYDSGKVPKAGAAQLASNHLGFDVTQSSNWRK